jgi:hypothetical protein
MAGGVVDVVLPHETAALVRVAIGPVVAKVKPGAAPSAGG